MQRNSYCSLKAPSLFLLCLRFSFHPLLATNVGFGPKIHGTDGEPTNSARSLARFEKLNLTRWNGGT
jgi:hypothetical protein